MTNEEAAEWVKRRTLIHSYIIVEDDKRILRGRCNLTINDLTWDEVNLLLVTFQAAKQSQSVTPKRKRTKK